MGEAIGLVDGKLNALVPCAIDDVEGVGALGPVNPVKSSHCVNVPKRELLGLRDEADLVRSGGTVVFSYAPKRRKVGDTVVVYAVPVGP